MSLINKKIKPDHFILTLKVIKATMDRCFWDYAFRFYIRDSLMHFLIPVAHCILNCRLLGIRERLILSTQVLQPKFCGDCLAV